MRSWSASMPELLQNVTAESVARLEKMDPEELAARAAGAPPGDDLPFRVTTERRAGETGGWLRSEALIGRGMWLWSIRRLLSGPALAALCSHRWTVLVPPDGEAWFTSDDPALKVNFHAPQKYDFRGGWGSDGTDLLLPLSPQHLLYTQVGKRVPRRGAQVEAAQAAIVRRLIAEHAHRYVFAASPHASVPALRPRVVDAAEATRERGEWAKWHAEQTAAERELIDGRSRSDRAT
jgi:hypothetical protein